MPSEVPYDPTIFWVITGLGWGGANEDLFLHRTSQKIPIQDLKVFSITGYNGLCHFRAIHVLIFYNKGQLPPLFGIIIVSSFQYHVQHYRSMLTSRLVFTVIVLRWRWHLLKYLRRRGQSRGLLECQKYINHFWGSTNVYLKPAC